MVLFFQYIISLVMLCLIYFFAKADLKYVIMILIDFGIKERTSGKKEIDKLHINVKYRQPYDK